MTSLAAPDATMYWLSRRTRNDQFLLYCFAESARTDTELRTGILSRCAAIPELRVRLRDDPTGLAYPRWIPAAPEPAQVRQHRLTTPVWPELLTALGELAGTGVDATEHPWLLHFFRGIRDSPAPDPQVTVVVLQISHALVDGRGAADLARALFTEPARPGAETGVAAVEHPQAGRSGPVEQDSGSRVGQSMPGVEPETSVGERLSFRARVASLRAAAVLPLGVVRTVRRGTAAAQARNELAALTAAGLVPPPGDGYPPGPLNGPVDVAGHVVRMVVCPADDFRIPGLSVTVVGLTVVSIALERYLRERGEEVTRLGAQVPMALPPRPGVRNNYRSLGVDLAAGERAPRTRAARIAAELAARRERAGHPLLDAQDAVTAVVPPLFLRRDVRGYPIDSVPEQITGHTVVSSVNRGPADLAFGGAPVRFTGGFPALGSVMHLTHGVHGLGETVTLSMHADPGVVEVDSYIGHVADVVRELPRLLA
ncbi:wax ester/triacylglycerol synthase domain-containing protein [Nocardia sp. CA-290969]|uniref:wax ester/triacylglycerol synthase domain-containing protein n=1 Tax=Nocardia sp. CA-290969 TaxID=3239986 RepID=UPI003D91E505